MLIGKDQIREVIERTDIVSLITRYVPLKRVGRSWKGLCPFHGEKTPSFYVNPERRSYKCFGCQKGGDAIRFLMEYEGKDFVTAVRDLAQAAGVPLVLDPEEDKRMQERRELLRACLVAARFFEETLWSPRGAHGRAHLEKRGVSEATAREAGLGYAPGEWHSLRDRFVEENVPLPRAEAAGLVASKAGGHFYDVFRGRLMVPIRDAEGRVIAFGGRVVEGDDPRKYINTRETPLYIKSKVLYGIDTAREAIRRSSEVTLVEGYFDAIALREAGIVNAVALCSTALTPDHVAQLKRLEVARVQLLLDGDEAGRKGAARLAGPLLASGLSARVVALPEGHDPDTFLREYGRPGYDALVEESLPLSAYVIGRALGAGGDSYEERLRALEELRPVVHSLPEGAQRSLFLGEIAKHLGLGAEDVARFFRGDAPKPVQHEAPPRPPQQQQHQHRVVARPGPMAARQPPAGRRELELVALLVAHPNLRPELGRELAGRLTHGALRELASLLVDGGYPAGELLNRLEPGLGQAVAARVRAALGAPEKDCRKELEDGLVQLDFERLQEERRAAIAERDGLENQLSRARDAAEQQELLSALQECGQQISMIRAQMERLREQLRGTA